LAFLPNWLNDAKDALALEALLSGWVRASGWRSAGLAWPADSGATVILTARADHVERVAAPPPELPEVVKSLRSGTATVVWQLPGSAGRLYSLLSPPGRPSGVLWAERTTIEPWGEGERHYLRLSARLIERSPALMAHTGPVADPDRLNHRLGDAAIIAGRMAHDFDNILTGIIGFADLTAPLLPAGSQPARYVSEIAKVGQRGIRFTQELHQLSRAAQSKPQPGSVAAVLGKEEARLRPTLPAGVNLITAIPGSLNAVAMEAGPLASVLGHLLANAIEATPAGGRVTVTARLVELSPSDARGYLGPVSPGSHVEVSIQDTGPGIKPDVRAKLFSEPFYTTKVRHRGLGLAVVYRTLTAHRGGVRIEPAIPPETGTVARIVIPPAAARPAVAPTVVAQRTALGGSFHAS
jgi:signal transduction histidine kinase